MYKIYKKKSESEGETNGVTKEFSNWSKDRIDG